MDSVDLYAMIIYMIYYLLVVFELLLFSFADTSVLPQVNDPQVCVLWLSFIMQVYLNTVLMCS